MTSPIQKRIIDISSLFGVRLLQLGLDALLDAVLMQFEDLLGALVVLLQEGLQLGELGVDGRL